MQLTLCICAGLIAILTALNVPAWPVICMYWIGVAVYWAKKEDKR